MKSVLRQWESGKKREAIKLRDMQSILEISAYNQKGGLKKSKLVHRYGNTHLKADSYKVNMLRYSRVIGRRPICDSESQLICNKSRLYIKFVSIISNTSRLSDTDAKDHGPLGTYSPDCTYYLLNE